MKAATLNDKERNILQTLEVVRDQNARGIIARNPEAKPTEFVSWFQLNRAFGITLTQLERLVKKGFLQKGDSFGSGPEFRKVT